MIKLNTTRFYLTVVMIGFNMSNMTYADESMRQFEFVPVGETRPEDRGRNGILMVSGALLSSPCTLVSNEVELDKIERRKGISDSDVLMLTLNGCGYGYTGDISGYSNTIAAHIAMLKNRMEDSDRNVISHGKVNLRDGENRILLYINDHKNSIKQNFLKEEKKKSHKKNDSINLMLIYE